MCFGSIISTDERTFSSLLRHATPPAVVLARFGAGIIGFPVAVLLHELAHFFAFVAFGFEDIVLRCASVEWSRGQEFWPFIQAGNRVAASAIAEPWQVAVATAAGPAMTYVTVIICACLIRVFGPSALILAVALAAPVRSVSILPLLGNRLFGHELQTGLDETRLATLTNISEPLLLVIAVMCLAGGWWLTVRAVPQAERRQLLVPAFVGIGVGCPVWLLWLGPWLLP